MRRGHGWVGAPRGGSTLLADALAILLAFTGIGEAQEPREPLPIDVEARVEEFARDPFFGALRHEVRWVRGSRFALFVEEPSAESPGPRRDADETLAALGPHLRRLERYFTERYARPLGLEPRPGFGRVPIWILADRPSFVRYCIEREKRTPDRGERSLYSEVERYALLYRDPEADDRDGDVGQTLHVATHALVDFHAPAGIAGVCSAWLREGLAEYLAGLLSPTERDGLPVAMARRLAEAQGVEAGLGRSGVSAEKGLRLARFEAADLVDATDGCATAGSGGASVDLASAHRAPGVRNPLFSGGLLVTYFLDRSPKAPPRERFLAFLREEMSGQGGAAAFRAQLAPDGASLEKLSAGFREFIRFLYGGGLRQRPLGFPSPDELPSLESLAEPAYTTALAPDDAVAEVLGLAGLGRYGEAARFWRGAVERAAGKDQALLERDRPLAEALDRFGKMLFSLVRPGEMLPKEVVRDRSDIEGPIVEVSEAGFVVERAGKKVRRPWTSAPARDWVLALRRADPPKGLDALACAAALDAAGETGVSAGYLGTASRDTDPGVAQVAKAYQGRREAYRSLAPRARACVLAEEILGEPLVPPTLAKFEELLAIADRARTPRYRERRLELRDAYVLALARFLDEGELLRRKLRGKVEPAEGGRLAFVYDWKDPSVVEDWVRTPHPPLDQCCRQQGGDPVDWTVEGEVLVGSGAASMRHRLEFQGEVEVEFEASCEWPFRAIAPTLAFAATAADDGKGQFASLFNLESVHARSASGESTQKAFRARVDLQPDAAYECRLRVGPAAIVGSVDTLSGETAPSRGFVHSGGVAFWTTGNVRVRIYGIRIVGRPSAESLEALRRRFAEEAAVAAFPPP